MSIYDQIREAREDLIARGIAPRDVEAAVGYFHPELASAYLAENRYDPFRFGAIDGGPRGLISYYDELPGYREIPFDAFTALHTQEQMAHGWLRYEDVLNGSNSHERQAAYELPHARNFATREEYEAARHAALEELRGGQEADLARANEQYDFRGEQGNPEALRLLRIKFLQDWTSRNAPHAAGALAPQPGQAPQGGPAGAPPPQPVAVAPNTVADVRATGAVQGAPPVDQPGAVAPQGPAPAQGQAGDYVNKVIRRRLGVDSLINARAGRSR